MRLDITNASVTGRSRTGFDYRKVQAHIVALCVDALQRVALYGMAAMQREVKVDTGFSRASITFDVASDGSQARFGVLSPIRHGGERGPSVGAILTWQWQGIRRHFVSFTDPGGGLRYSLVKWAERHGFTVWSAGPKRKLKLRGLRVWGYAHPWLTNALRAVRARLPSLLGTVKGRL